MQQQQRSLNVKFNLAGTNRMDEVFNLSLTLPTRLELNVLENGDFIEREFEFSTGILAKVSNSIILQVRRNTGITANPMMCLFTKLDQKPDERVGVANGQVTLSFEDVNNPGTAVLSPITSHADYRYFDTRDGYTQFEFLPSPWPEQAYLANFSIPVFYRKLPLLKDERTVKLKEEYLLGKVDSKDFFMSETFSDVVIECEEATFPAHRLILAGSSPVFKAMLTHPTKEAEKGRIVISEVNSEVFEGLLQFIYTGKIATALLDEYGEELYRAADKYNVEDLLLICENHLLNSVKVENAMVMYDLAQCRPKSLLAKKSSDIIARNKDKIAADVASFKNFTNKHPELMFEIFKR